MHSTLCPDKKWPPKQMAIIQQKTHSLPEILDIITVNKVKKTGLGSV